MSRARIGILVRNDDPATGPGRYVRSLLGALNEDEFDVTLFAAARERRDGVPRHVRVESFRAEGAAGETDPVVGRTPAASSGARALARSLTPFSIRYSLGFSREAERLAEILHRHPVDLLHTCETGCEESAVAARLAGVPAVLGTFHVLPSVDVEQRQQRWIHRRLERRAVRALDVGIAVSQAGNAAWAERTGLPRLVTIHNGINPNQFRRRRDAFAARAELAIPVDGSIVVGAVGRLAAVKGHASLIEAAARLRGLGLGVRVVLAGSGPMLTELQSLADQLGIESFVHFVGHRSDVPAVLEAFDVFAHPSLSEALPYAVMEAMSMGLPVVASDVGGIPEIVARDQTGFLVPPGDIDGLASGLRALIESPELRVRMGCAGRQRILDCFDEQRMTDRTIALYRSLLRESRVAA